jgi:putative membrane protein
MWRMDNEYHFWGMHFFWWIFWIIVLIWIFLTPWDIPGQRFKRETALGILKKRFAKGEVSLEEFEEFKKAIKKKKKITKIVKKN